jgi:preprotein translocase SecF subunit
MLAFPLRLVKTNTNINFIKQRYGAYAFSLIITILTVLFLFIKGLNFGIDFTGGVIVEIGDESNNISIESVRETLRRVGYHSATIQHDDKNNIIMRFQPKDSNNHLSEIKEVKKLIQDSYDSVVFRRVDYVGPKIGSEMIVNGVIAVFGALAAMMLYVTVRFSWVFGVGVVIALLHDIIAMIGFYIISQYEFDSTSIAAILTIIGYSVTDSVVIYDRIRENIGKHPRKKIMEIINLSINETLSRTVMTVLTTLVVCLALVLFGGPVLRGFSAAILFGIAFGTYSSIYISAIIIMAFNKNAKKTV